MSIRDRFRIGQTVTLDGHRAKVAQFSPGGNYVHITIDVGGTYALGESEARRRVRIKGEDPRMLLPPAQRRVLDEVRAGDRFVHGPDVRTARQLERAGLVTLTDNGHMQKEIGSQRSDRERWWCKAVPTS